MSEATPLQAAPATLPPAPYQLAREDGTPAYGLYSGYLSDAGFANLRGAFAPSFLQRRLTEKKWQYVWVATPEMMLSMAIVDTGYLASGFCAIFDRGSRRLLFDNSPVLPSPLVEIAEHPADGMSARLFGPGLSARMERSGGRVAVSAKWGHASVELSLDTRQAPPCMTAIAPVAGEGRFDCTQKTVLVPAEGEVRAANCRFPVQGALAGLDYTHGYLARETEWKWGFAGGRQGARRIAFNLSDGFLQGAGENVLWVDDEPRALGPVQFSWDPAAPLAPWKVRTGDGLLDLTFQPEGLRQQTVDLKLILSKYVQPFGSYSGTVTAPSGEKIAIDQLPGVTEDHAARW